jgi:hypothetical protein
LDIRERGRWKILKFFKSIICDAALLFFLNSVCVCACGGWRERKRDEEKRKGEECTCAFFRHTDAQRKEESRQGGGSYMYPVFFLPISLTDNVLLLQQ